MKKNVLVICFYSLATLILTYPLARFPDRVVYTTSDSFHSAWILDRNFYSLTHQPLKEFFNTNIFFPYQNNLAYSDHLLGETILSLPLRLFTDNPILIQNVLILFSFVFSGFFTFLLVDYWLKNKNAAFIAGFAFAFSNFRFQQLDHLNILSSQWLPLVFLYLQKWLDQKKKKLLFLFGLSYLLTVLSSMHYALMVSLALLIYLVTWFFFLRPNNFKKSDFLPLIATILVTLFLCLPVFLPYLNFKKEFPGIGRSLRDNVAGSASLASFFFTAASTRISRINWFEHLSEADAGLFPGFVFLILLILGWRHTQGKNQRQHLFFLFLSATFLIFSLGPILRFFHQNDTSLPLPYLLFYLLIPPLKMIRTPVRWYLFFLLFALFFLGRGVVFLNKIFKRKICLLVLLIVFLSLESFSIPLDLVFVPQKKEFPPVYHWLAQQPGEFTILELPIPQVTDPSLFQNKKQPYGFLKNLTAHEFDTIEAYRIYFSTLHHQNLVNGYSAFFPPLYLETVQKSQNFLSDDFLRLLHQLAVKYIIIHREQLAQQQQADFDLVIKNNRFQLIKEFENKDYVFSLKNE